MSARDTIFTAIRHALGVTGNEAPRRKEVADRLRDHPRGVIPERGQRPDGERIALCLRMIEAVAGTTERIPSIAAVPAAVANYLRANDLPLALKRGGDPRLAAVRWDDEPELVMSVGSSHGDDLVAISFAYGAVAETGTLVLLSGPDNPTTLNFLPDHHIVLVEAGTIAGDYETVLARLREERGAAGLPRAINLITGPSRTADIEQTLILGAHGPRRLHVIVLEE